MQSLIPVVMSGIIAVYGLVVAVLISGKSACSPCLRCSTRLMPVSPVKPGDYSLFAGFIHLAAGLACGLTGMAAGYAIGIVGDSVCNYRYISLPNSLRILSSVSGLMYMSPRFL